MRYRRNINRATDRSRVGISPTPPNYPIVFRYKHDVDKTMVQVKFESDAGAPLGVINWYAVHATSMNNTNRLVSSDNVGYASVLFEQRMNPDSFIGKVRGRGAESRR